MENRKLVSVAVVVLLFVALAARGDDREARRILDATGVQGGLVVHLGCGDGALTAGLGAGESYLVHGLDEDAGNIAKARDLISGKGFYGRVSVERWSDRVLPYSDNVVNLLVAEDLGDVPMAEVMRVLCPRGAAYLKEGEVTLLSTSAFAAEIGFPASRDISFAKSFLFLAIISAVFLRISALLKAGMTRIILKAFKASFIASSISDFLP